MMLHSLEDVFHAIVDLPPEQWEARLEYLCEGREELRREVAALLAADKNDPRNSFSSVLTEVASPGSNRPPEGAPLPSRIGHYRVHGVLGEGGMGVVYEAEQDQPRRLVAVKLIRIGHAGKETIRRFEREAEILGALNHPGIAHVYEAGIADVEYPARARSRASLSNGDEDASSSSVVLQLPFLAMELVRGSTLVQYVKRNEFSLRERLALLTGICEAVAYAHTQGIVHRDLKPGNILVCDEASKRRSDEGLESALSPSVAMPKILDFGVARFVASDVAAMTRHTQTGQLVGTLEYMSPEQFVGKVDQLDARSDVYSLGIILYELIAGRTPFDLSQCSIAEAARRIRDEEPPSLTGTSIGRKSRTGAARVDRDLHTIVLKALEKEPSRRYRSAGELADELRRYLRDQPIVARPPSTLYQLRKFARRNRGLVLGLAATLLMFALGAVVSTLFALRSERLRQLADSKTLEAERQAYQSSLAGGSAALRNHDVDAALELLAAAPRHLRGWEWDHLCHAAESSSAEFPHRAEPNSALQVSGNERVLVTVSPDGNVAVFDLNEQSIRHQFQVNLTRLSGRHIALNQSGSRILIPFGQDLAYGVWDTSYGRLLWSRPAGVAHRGGFSPDEKLLALPDPAGSAILLHDSDTGAVIRQISCSSPAGQLPYFAEFSSQGNAILVGYHDGKNHVVDLKTEQIIGTIHGWHFAMGDAHQRWLAFIDGDLCLFQSAQGEASRSKLTSKVDHLFWSYSSRTIAVKFVTGEFTLFDEDLIPLTSCYLPRGGPARMLDARGELLTLDPRGTIRLYPWFVSSCPFVVPHPLRFFYMSAAFTPDGRGLAIGDWGHLRMYDTGTGSLRWTAQLSRSLVTATGFSHDGRLLLLGNHQGQFSLLDAENGRVINTVPTTDALTLTLIGNPPSRTFLAGLHDGRIVAIDPIDWEAEFTTVGSHASPVHALALDPDGGYLASGSGDGVDYPNYGVASSGAGDHSVKWWNLSNGELIREIHCPQAVTALAWSPNGRQLAGAVQDGTLRVWDAEDGKEVAKLPSDPSCHALLFHPENHRLAAVGSDYIRIWETERFQQLATIPNAAGTSRSASFTPQGKSLLVSGAAAALAAFETEPVNRDMQDSRFRALWALQWLNRGKYRYLDEIESDLQKDEVLPREIRDHVWKVAQTAGDHIGWLISDAISEIHRRDTPDGPRHLAGAISLARRAGELMPADPTGPGLLAKGLYFQGDYREALDAANECIRRCQSNSDSPDYDIYAVQALCLFYLNRPVDAGEALDRAREAASKESSFDKDSQELLSAASRVIGEGVEKD